MITYEDIGTRVHVVGGDYTYDGWLVAVFTKHISGAIRCVVQDDQKRLFIHRPSQIFPAPLPED